jgi:hypothetical protein
MQDRPFLKRRDRLRGWNDVSENRLTRYDASQRFLIGGIDKLQERALWIPSSSKFGQEAGKVGIAAGGGTPADMNDLRALTGKILGKQLKADVDDSRRLGQERAGLRRALDLLNHPGHPSSTQNCNPHKPPLPNGLGMLERS